MHTFMTVVEAEELHGLSDEARALDRAALHAISFHDPKRLKEERVRLQRRIRKLAGSNGDVNQRALDKGQQIIETVKVIGGPR